jgi:hypothetical protein
MNNIALGQMVWIMGNYHCWPILPFEEVVLTCDTFLFFG